MRELLVLVLLAVVGLTGCTGVDAPCLPWDDGCATAAHFAEAQLGAQEWNAVAVREIACEDAAGNRGAFVPDQCWAVTLRDADAVSTEAVVLLTTQGDLILMGQRLMLP